MALRHRVSARIGGTSPFRVALARLARRPVSVPEGDMSDLEENTIVIDVRDGLWRMRVWPGMIRLFRSRELAEAHARDLASSKSPAWRVIVREPVTR